ncbi:MAG: ribonuclease P protein component [Terriglobales bacterium]
MPSAPVTATSSFRWPQRRRLLRRREFRAAYEQGLRRSSRHFTVFGLASAQPGVRFGITASRKLGPAVVRNRLRRRTRELLRRLPAGIAGIGCAVVVNPRPSVATAGFAELARELEMQVKAVCASLRQKTL